MVNIVRTVWWRPWTLAAKEKGLEWARRTMSQWGWQTPLSEHVYCVAVTFKMTEGGEQWICIKFCIQFEHSSAEASRVIQKDTAMGNWWLAASSQRAHWCIMSRAEFFGETSDHPGDSTPLQPRFGALRLLAFPKTKITCEKEAISDHGWDSGKYDRAADGDWENYVRSQGACFEGVWDIIVLCKMFLVSSSINVSIFHITWLDTFWIVLIYLWDKYMVVA